MLKKDYSLLSKLEEEINYKFKDLSLLKEALTHSSYRKKGKKEVKNNQRMEFLGDSVLELIVNEYIYHKFSTFSEGEMTKMKSFVVSKPTLTEWANSIFLGDYIILGKGEDLTGGRKKSSIHADCFEALLGAIYLDGGTRKAKKFILQFLKKELLKVIEKDFIRNYKSLLQEISQKEYKCLPDYKLIREKGPDHKKMFCINVTIKEKMYGTGFGDNKKEAEQNAAKDTLKKLKMIK
jgi:ribonuclease-3